MSQFIMPPAPTSPVPSPAAKGPEPRRPAHAPLRQVRGRNGEILSRTYRADDLPSQFDIPQQYQEPGWSLQWVRVSTLNEPDSQSYNEHYANGWRPVPAGRVPDQFNAQSGAEHVVRQGLMLMERPESLTKEAIEESRSAAYRQKHNTAAEFTGVEKILEGGRSIHHGAFVPPSKETDSRGKATPKLNRTLEGSPTALYPQRQYAVGDEE